MSERDVQDAIRLTIGSRDGVVLWRNQVGAGVLVEPGLIQRLKQVVRSGLPAKALEILEQLSNRHFTKSGMARGASDLIGMYHGRFMAIEVKARAGKPSEDQELFLDLVQSQGGIAILAYSVTDVEVALDASDNHRVYQWRDADRHPHALRGQAGPAKRRVRYRPSLSAGHTGDESPDRENDDGP